MKKTCILFIVLACSSVSRLYGEDIGAAFRAVNAAYTKAADISMQVHYNLYTNYISTTPYESNTGEYVKQGNNYYSSLLGITTIQNSRYMLSVSDNDKTIIVSDPKSSEKPPSLPQIDSILAHCSSTETMDEANGDKNYILHFEKSAFSEFDRIEIEINMQHFVNRITLYYREAVTLDETNPSLKKEKPRLEITYTTINTHPEFVAEQFSEKKYIHTEGKKITPAPSFATYRLLNYKN